MANNIQKMMAVIVLSVLTTTASVYSMQCTTGIPPQYCKDTHTITVQGDCNNVTSFCSLTSAIDYIASSSRDQWIIQVNYNHSIDQLSATVNVSCLIICGIGQQLPVILVNHTIDIESTHGYLEFTNIQLDFASYSQDTNHLQHFDAIQLSNVIISNGFDWELTAVNITIRDSTFSNNYYVRALLQLAADHSYLSHVTIVNSTAITNNVFAPIFIPFSSKTNTVIYKCHILNSTANLSLLDAASVLYINALVWTLNITSSEFSVGSQKFKYGIYHKFPTYNITLYDVTIQNQLPSVCFICFDNYFKPTQYTTVRIENSLFKYNKGTNIRLLSCYDNCEFLLTNNIFTHNKGTMVHATSSLLIISNNTMSYITNQVFLDIAVMFLDKSSLTFAMNSNFTNNVGTAVKLVNPLEINFNENSTVQFYNNTGRNGGALQVICNELCDSFDEFIEEFITRATFTNNLAVYGGAMYIQMSNNGSLCYLVDIFSYKKFVDNKAISDGNTVAVDYTGTDIPSCMSENITLMYYSKIRLLPTYINKSMLTLFPGEYIRFAVNSTMPCEATMYLTCNNSVNNCPVDEVLLSGPTNVVIPNRLYVTIDTNIQLRATPTSNTNVSLSLLCGNFTSSIPLQIKNCPLSFTYNEANMTCEPCFECNSDLYKHSLYEGAACLKHGYWFGEDDSIYHCYYPHCKFSSDMEVCPIPGYQRQYILLPDYADSQCNQHKSGTLCRGCIDNYTFTYLAVECVPNDKESCYGWLFGLLLPLSIFINVIVGLLWIVMVIERKKDKKKDETDKEKETNAGVIFGSTFGPIFFLTNANLLPLASYGFPGLDGIFSFLSLLILDNSILGYIPVCTPIQSALGFQYFHYIGPILFLSMIGIIYILANKINKLNDKISVCPMRATSLLLFVTFWSMANTSINIVLPIILNDARFSLEPDVPYLHSSVPWYAVIIWIIAVAILICILSLIGFMLIVPLLSRWFNVSSANNFLDVYQSCYKDKWRWYCSVYFIVWIILSVAGVLTSVDIYIAYVIRNTTLIVVTIMHCAFHPYKNDWLNRIDAYLLIDLVLLVSIAGDVVDVDDYNMTTLISFKVILYALIFPPIIYILLAPVVILICKFQQERLEQLLEALRTYFSRQQGMKSQLELNTNNADIPQTETENVTEFKDEGFRRGPAFNRTW